MDGIEDGAGGSFVAACRLIALPRVRDPRGALTFVEGGGHIPFEIARVYYVYDLPEGAFRGGHAHRVLQQLIICLTGRFTVRLDDGARQREVGLCRPDQGLYVPTMIWRELVDFSAGAVCLVLASHHYDRADYIYDHAEFVSLKQGR